MLPFVLILSVTGSIYLFKPQIDRWEERAYRDLGTQASRVAGPATGGRAGGQPRRAASTIIACPSSPAMPRWSSSAWRTDAQREVYVSPQGQVLGALDPEARISATVVADPRHRSCSAHWGDWLVELAASWTIVMILTGLYMWWPRPFRPAGTFWPRLSLTGRPAAQGPPPRHRLLDRRAGAGRCSPAACPGPEPGAAPSNGRRTELGLVEGPQDWKIGAGGGHAGHHDMTAMAVPPAASRRQGLPLSGFVAKAQAERMAFPVVVLPPHAPQRFGPPTGNVWTAKSETQNRPLARQVTYDPATGAETGRSGFADTHVVDRIVNTGIAWHEGQLFGWPNQLLGLVTALALIAISIMGVLMWLKRRPQGELGAPPATATGSRPLLLAGIVVLAIILPLFGLSLIGVLLTGVPVAAQIQADRELVRLASERRQAIDGRRFGIFIEQKHERGCDVLSHRLPITQPIGSQHRHHHWRTVVKYLARSYGSIARCLIAVLFAVVASGAASAQTSGSIEGRVVDMTGAPVAGARVELTVAGRTRSVGTDSAGRYRFDGVPPGSYRVVATHVGLAPSSADATRRRSVR